MFSRRTWMGAVLAALASFTARLTPAAARTRRPRPNTRHPEYKTRWIGHY